MQEFNLLDNLQPVIHEKSKLYKLELKSKDELNSVKKVIFDEIQNKLITKSYSFKLNPQEEKKQFDFSVNFPKKAKSNNLINQENNFKSASKTTVNPKLKKQATFL